MIDAMTGIEGTVAGLTFADYQRSWPTRRAVERGIEIISEASRHIPEDLKERYPLLAGDLRDRQSPSP